MKFNRKRSGISYIMEVVMMTLVVTALASVVLSWGLGVVASSRTSLTNAVNARMTRLQEGLVVEDLQLVSSTTARAWIRNTGGTQIVIDQLYINNVQSPIVGVCSPGTSPSGGPPPTCPSGTKLSLPVQAVGAVDVTVPSAQVVALTGTATGAGTTTTLNDNTRTWTANQWTNCLVTITAGTDSGQGAKTIASNSATQLTVSGGWSAPTDSTSQYAISGICSGASYNVIAATTRGTTFQGSFTL